MRDWTASLGVAALSLLLCGPGQASADTLVMTVFGRDFVLAPDDGDDGLTALKIDGKKLMSGFVLTVDRIDVMDGVPFILGSTGVGGRVCEPSPFVISLPEGKPPRVDGPIGDCGPIEEQVRSNAIVFTEKAFPGEAQRTWTWTPAGGMRREDKVAKPKAGSGWDILREQSAGHPAELLRWADVSALMMARVGRKNEDLYREQLDGIGSLDWRSGMVSGASCRKPDCEEAGQLTVFDLETRTVFVALKPVGGKIMVFPPVKEWPRDARDALKTWAEPWS